MFIFVLDCVVSEGNQASYLQTESPQCVGSRSNLNSFLKPLWAYSDPLSVCVTMCPIWDLGSNLFYSIALKAFGMLLKIHAYAAWVQGQKFIYNFIGSCSFHNALNTFLLLETFSPGLLSAVHFLHLNLPLGSSGKVTERKRSVDSPHGSETKVPLFGEEGFPSFLVLLGFPCGSAGKESACNVGDLGSIPGL